MWVEDQPVGRLGLELEEPVRKMVEKEKGSLPA